MLGFSSIMFFVLTLKLGDNLFLKEIFLSPGHDRVVTIKSQNFFYCESLVLSGFLYWSTRGCNLAAHSSFHASFILRRGLTRFQLPKILLSPKNIECRNPSDILEWGPGAILIGNITLIAPNHLQARIGYPAGTYSWQP